MFQGFYNLTSGMITHNRKLNVISNNIGNVLTPGFKKDTMVSSTFQEELMSRTGNIDKRAPEELNDMAMLRSALETVTDYSQGVLEPTDSPLDFAMTEENRYFRIEGPNGVLYTRNGSFAIDEEGYLGFPEGGRVLGKNGPIYLGADDISANSYGMIFREDGTYVDQLDIVSFAEDVRPQKIGGSLFETDAQPVEANGPSVMHKTLERSNVDATVEFTAMIENQRALQTSAQVLKIYDQLMGKATTQIGNI